MYEEFYGLAEKPFSPAPTEDCFFMSPQHAHGMATLQYALLANAGMTLITADSGLGKTAILKRVMSNLDSSINVALVSNTHPQLGRLVPWILAAFQVPADYGDELACYAALRSFLHEQANQKVQVVLAIDEAHNLSAEAFEELRLVNNLNVNDSTGVQIVLSGRPELAELLMKDEQRHISQRIAIDFRITPFDYEVTDEYISYRLRLFGGKPELFDYLARAAIFYHSHGIPRLINSVCDLALVYGYGESLDTIDIGIVKKVLLSKKVSLSFFNRLERSRSAVDLHAMVLNSHGVDIARFTLK